jgi:flap endonuclease-1
MRRYSSQFVRLTGDIIEESKELLKAMGIPFIQAIGEGEAEAVFLVKHKKANAVASQDYDALLFGAPFLVRNLTLSRKRKTASGAYVEIHPELIEFQKLLNTLDINHEQLICIGILVGTDYNPGGIKGIGPKTALEIVKKYKYPVQIFDYVKNNPKYADKMNFNWQEIFLLFHEYPCCVNPIIKFGKVDDNKVREILTKRDFSLERINSGLEKLKVIKEKSAQKKLF